MTSAPIDARYFAQSQRVRRVNPAACRLAPLLRLALMVALGGALASVALSPRLTQAGAASARI
ncbi:hypothetical protein SAMN06265338_10518 [Rhodoblastus acidophilus]|uniref:Uncharacterized protein n=1 Tax=Rhodoblastus acidophilus TaxID=1074 RepID=A0A212RK52_RHOAC|nr:hypothetical protein [Rhodoblastus acidophilus]MCW2315928.1 hypothetical protein [Rhodoblastus acidophilus]PPQ35075.1 hypothetical protein CKO16_21075 [Rhodoblastus acidophilus]RAI16202.1 hypothetical protein CH337_22630 [Rhodoblastus acidophilus]SNB72834.1 hypothetical protein SAMN06265338_10518 [Rhodoblastus acidophilus]